MLTQQDIEMIRATRQEITHNRQTLITIAYMGAGTIDVITDEEIDGEIITRDVMSVVTEITTLAESGIERQIIGGVAVEKGDLWLSIEYVLIEDIYGKLDKLRYDSGWYAIIASDKKGIGGPNRVEVVGRAIT